MTHSKKNWLIAFAGLAAINLWSCSSSHSAEEKKSLAAPVEVFELTRRKITSSTQIPGELLSFRDVDLYAKVNSFVKQLYVDVGSEVKEGQMLALLEAPEIRSQINAAKSRVESQTAIYKASKANYDRMLETSKTPGTISQNDLDQALGKMNSDYSQLEAAQATEREVMVMQGYLEVRAPFDGTISARNINVGAYVGPSGKGSDLPMFILNEQKHLRLAVYVPESITGYVQLNDEIHFSIKTFLNQTFSARVRRKAGALDKKLRAQRIEMDVTNDSRKLIPGMIAEVRIELVSAETFAVPLSAVVNSTEKLFVIRLKNKKAEWVDVKKGLETNGYAEVFGNLSVGDQLVRQASEELRNGMNIGEAKLIPLQQ